MDSIINEVVKSYKRQIGQRTGHPKGVSVKLQQTEVDKELEEILRERKARIVVVGCGGAGNNTITRMMEVGIYGAELIAINTDAQDLLYTSAHRKVLIGKKTTRGLGAGGDPKIGEEAAKENEEEIKQLLEGTDLVFITCGLGGGTGTGSAPIIAEISKRLGALTIGVVTFPFTMEGARRIQNAVYGLERLRKIADTVIVIPNDKLLEIAPSLPITLAFKVADEILVRAVKGITELITKPGLINLDFADIRAVMKNGGLAVIGMGESDSENRAVEAVEKAIKNPLLSVDISGAKGALINITGSEDLTLSEAEKAVSIITEKLDPNANIIWGATLDEELKNKLRVTVIVTGVRSPQIFGRMEEEKREEKVSEVEKVLDRALKGKIEEPDIPKI